jgi:hypothetical protein
MFSPAIVMVPISGLELEFAAIEYGCATGRFGAMADSVIQVDAVLAVHVHCGEEGETTRLPLPPLPGT